MSNQYLLAPGDKVALISPARKISREEMQGFLGILNAWKLVPQTSEYLFGEDGQFSGTDEQRAEDFNKAWNDPEIKAIFCARGGYGSMRILDYLDIDVTRPKLLIGYSDITTLQLYLAKRNIVSVHGPMAINARFNNYLFDTENFDLLYDCLFEGKLNYYLDGVKILNQKPFEGKLIGGNLSLLYASLGTPEQPDTKGKVLFIEEIDEYLYHIDRMVVSMKRAGMFDEINALILGDFTDIKDNASPFGLSIEEIFTKHLPDKNIPVITNFPAGHGLKNFCIAINVHCTFDGKYFYQKLA